MAILDCIWLSELADNLLDLDDCNLDLDNSEFLIPCWDNCLVQDGTRNHLVAIPVIGNMSCLALRAEHASATPPKSFEGVIRLAELVNREEARDDVVALPFDSPNPNGPATAIFGLMFACEANTEHEGGRGAFASEKGRYCIEAALRLFSLSRRYRSLWRRHAVAIRRIGRDFSNGSALLSPGFLANLARLEGR